MIERRHWVGVYILCLGLAGVVGCSKKADLRIIELTTSEGALLERPIRGSSQVNAKIRNFANGPLTISRGAGPGALWPDTKGLWSLGIEARYQDGGQWESLKGGGVWTWQGRATVSAKGIELDPGKMVVLSMLVSNPVGFAKTTPPKEVRCFVVDPQGRRMGERTAAVSAESSNR